MSDLEQAMAIDIINLMKAMASKKKDEVSNDEERGRIREEIEMYCYEEGGASKVVMAMRKRVVPCMVKYSTCIRR